MEQQINISQNNNQEILINSNEPQLISLTNNEVQDILINQNENQNLNVTQADNQLILIDGGGNIIGITDVLVNGVSVVSGNIAYITVPTKTSELINDSGYITSETDPTVPSYIKQISLSDINSWNNKQDELVSGSTIKTINNESLLGSGNINITGTQYNAGDGISIENDIISNTITSYNDLSDLPSIPTKTSDLINDSEFVSEDDLSEVAFTGSYNSLSDTPIIPDSTSDLINDSGYIDNTVNNLTNYTTTTNLNSLLGGKQDTLVSGTNIKTINNNSLLGSGNITISGGTPTDVQVNGTSITSNNVANLITNGTYNSSTNKIATMSDIPTATSQLTNTGADGTHPYIPALDSGLKGLGVTSGRLFWEYGTALTDTTLANYSDIPTNVSQLNNDSYYGKKTDVEINGVSINRLNVNQTEYIADIQTNSAYDSSTNKIATMNDIPKKNILSAKPSADVTLTGGSYIDINNLTATTTIGSGLSISSGKIKIGSGISNIKVTVCMGIYANTNDTLYSYLTQNGTTVSTWLVSKCNGFSSFTRNDIISVSENDLISFNIYLGSGGELANGRTSIIVESV